MNHTGWANPVDRGFSWNILGVRTRTFPGPAAWVDPNVPGADRGS